VEKTTAKTTATTAKTTAATTTAKTAGTPANTTATTAAEQHHVTVSQVAPEPHRDARSMSAAGLVSETAKEAISLLRAEIDLAKSELKEDLTFETKAAKGLTVATVCALAVFNLLLVAAAVALAQVLPLWASTLAVAGAVAVFGTIAAAFGWKHVRKPLERTRHTLKEDLQWMKERTA
jgi:hypothetical protein